MNGWTRRGLGVRWLALLPAVSGMVAALFLGVGPASVEAQVAVQSVPSGVAPRRIAQVTKLRGASDDRLAGRKQARWIDAPAVQWDRFDVAALIAEDQQRDLQPGVPMRVGIHRPVPARPITTQDEGQWERLADGMWRWRLQLDVPGALALRVHFSGFDLPPGGRLTIAGGDQSPVAVYTGKGFRNQGAFWTPPTSGNVAFLEYVGSADSVPAVMLQIDEVSHFYRGPWGAAPPPIGEKADGAASQAAALLCHEDPNCHGADANARDAVARIVFSAPGGSFLCSGALLNDQDDNTFAGYFLTANHCISSASSANSVAVYWFYQTPECGGVVPSLSSVPRSNGAQLLATSASTDFTLMRLYDDPHDGQGFAAWTTSTPGNGDTVMGIHHPGGNYKRYAEGPVTSAQPICNPTLPLSRFIYNDWTPGKGITEGGSSGSPLFNSNWEVIGQLFGVCFFSNPRCSNPEDYNNVYGRFEGSYAAMASFLTSITPDDAFEDNDTLTTAAAISPGTYELQLVDFDDYFSVTLTEPREITATVTFVSSEVNIDLRLLSASGIALDVSSGTGSTETVSAALGLGTYVLHASRDGGQGGGYSLELTSLPTDCPLPSPADPEPAGVSKNRFLSFIPGNPGRATAISMEFVSLQHPVPPNGEPSPPPDFSAFEGVVMWVGPPETFFKNAGAQETFQASRLQCDPYFQEWDSVGLLYVYGPEVVPSSVYDVQMVSQDCGKEGAQELSI
ncbi:MAG: trypsin-like peptidase domain-containing protein, partial [Planctomycetes bacterium]|nr:trypsin-like peptidase domain-containing protein [Planctomycetota bacterium]